MKLIEFYEWHVCLMPEMKDYDIHLQTINHLKDFAETLETGDFSSKQLNNQFIKEFSDFLLAFRDPQAIKNIKCFGDICELYLSLADKHNKSLRRKSLNSKLYKTRKLWRRKS